MKKRVISLILILLILPFVLASSIDSEMQKITYYAEEYETGNIDYVKLMLYLSSAREGLNEILGVRSKDLGGFVKQEKLTEVLGEANEKTKWVWVEGENHDTKLDDAVPIWKKIVFDGKKIQIRMEAFPAIFKKKMFEEEFDVKGFEKEIPEEGSIIYRLNFNTEFKKPQEQLDIQGKIDEIQALAKSGASMETLAKESVNAEMIFQNYFKQGEGKCEDIMKLIFGSENQRQTQQMLLNEIEFFDGGDFEVILRLEMCDECEGNWINLDMRFEGRGKFNPPKQTKEFGEIESRKRFESMTEEGLKTETQELISEIIRFLEIRDYESAMVYMNKLRTLTEAWNQKANNVWEEVEGEMPGKRVVEKNNNQENVVVQNEISGENNQDEVVVENTESESSFIDNSVVDNTITENVIVGNFITGNVIENNEQSKESQDPYYWIKKDQQNRLKVKELRKQNYESRKAFYLGLFGAYEKQEYYFEQTSFEKRLVEEFRERGEEICNNNKDDNENQAVDCDDAQCGGKICGRGTNIIENVNTLSGHENLQLSENLSAGNTIIEEIDFYCISGICQAKEEIIQTETVICGNHVCEEGEEFCSSSIINCEEDNLDCVATSDCGPVYCPEDCILCPTHAPLNCAGKVIFSGKDENGCPLAPVCVRETEFCISDLDCPQPLCGIAECVVEDDKEIGKCQVTELKECDEIMCNEGEEIVEECKSGEEIVTGFCDKGVWVDIDVKCFDGGESCEQECRDFSMASGAACSGEANLKISGTYPDCECGWECEKIVGGECVMASDCGGENDVCSNGKCVIIPEVVRLERDCSMIDCEDGYECIDGDCIKLSGTEPLEEQELEEIGVEGQESASEIEEEEQEEIVQESEEQEISEPEPEEVGEEEVSEPESNEVTGGFIFNFFRTMTGRITGAVVDEGGDVSSDDSGIEEVYSDTGDVEVDEDGDYPDTDDGEYNVEPESEPDNDCADKWKACGEPCPPCDYDERLIMDGELEAEEKDFQDDSKEWERKNKEEMERNEKENKQMCEKECARPCVEKCIREICGDELDCNIDEESKSCEKSCGVDNSCIKKCMSGEQDWWKEFENNDMNKQEKGVFQVGGGCRKEQGRTESYIWFGGWGEPFEQLEPLKRKYYEKGDEDWCKYELENLIKQRKEFEKGFNQEFVEWFFENYLANAAENWEQSVSGIFELYWGNVENQMRLANNMKCLGKSDITDLMEINLINIGYETKYGKVEYWEELQTVNLPELDKSVTIVSPYMKIWVFPNKKFFAYEMKQSMEKHEFPGAPEEKIERQNQEGPTEEEKEMIKQDKRFMNKIKKISEKYQGNVDAVVQFKDFETEEVAFNLYAQVNEDDILKLEPMLYGEIPEEDVRIEIDFEKIYEMIYSMEKDMQGEFIESPPWDREKIKPVQKIKDVTNGIKMYFKIRGIINSAKIYPEEARGDVESLFKDFFSMMGKGERDKNGFEGGGSEDGDALKGTSEKEDIWESKDKITGEVIG
ncbi:MAG: hypothetical protein KJ646_01875 [Nanoarchaeota archaeon]|nr:hypothetical protein [Nanoarchaeota archaeon]MBU4116832.1 hypothetical protein [Nanoarchaeota archaeon]